MADRPEDACPYPRPFSDTFDGCPAFIPAEYLTQTMAGAVLSVPVCLFLGSGSREGRFYALCRHGTAGERQAWAAGVGAERILQIRGGWQEMAPNLRPMLIGLRELRLRGGPLSPDDVRELRLQWDAEVDRLIGLRAGELDDLGIPGDLVRQLAASIRDHLLSDERYAESWVIPDDLLRALPAHLSTFFRPWAKEGDLARRAGDDREARR